MLTDRRTDRRTDGRRKMGDRIRLASPDLWPVVRYPPSLATKWHVQIYIYSQTIHVGENITISNSPFLWNNYKNLFATCSIDLGAIFRAKYVFKEKTTAQYKIQISVGGAILWKCSLSMCKGSKQSHMVPVQIWNDSSYAQQNLNFRWFMNKNNQSDISNNHLKHGSGV